MGDSHVGLQARLMSQAMRKLAGALGKTNCVGIFINQLREKVGVVYGNPEVTPGGRALKFFSSVRIDVRRAETLKNGTEMVGATTKCKIVKNKVSPPFKTAVFDIMYGEGISHESELVDLGVEFGILKKSGAWFSYGETRIGQGRDNTKKYLKENTAVAAEIEAKIRQAFLDEKAENESKKASDSKVIGKAPAAPSDEAAEMFDESAPASKKAAKIDLDVLADDFE